MGVLKWRLRTLGEAQLSTRTRAWVWSWWRGPVEIVLLTPGHLNKVGWTQIFPGVFFFCVVLNIYLFLVSLGLSCGKQT